MGDADYEMLYVCLGDGSSSLYLLDENMQSTHSFLGTIFRLNPSGNNSANGQYGIPTDNPFLNSTDPDVLKEIYAYGFRNPHRISWDTEGDHLMLEGDIGEKNIEELNLILPGKNYGWNEREGTFLFNNTLGQDFVFELPSNDLINDYTYPVAMYDHDEGLAIVGGYVYRGDQFPELYGQYLFGDIVNGRIFHVPVDSLELGKSAKISSVIVRDQNGSITSILNEVDDNRADLRFGTDRAGEIYILTKGDGRIYKIMDPDYVSNLPHFAIGEEVNWLTPNPSNGTFTFLNENEEIITNSLQIFNAIGELVFEQKNLERRANVNLTYLPKGNYWARFLTDKINYTQQIILK